MTDVLLICYRLTPQLVKFPEHIKLTQAHCGETGTMFISDCGSVFACGSNEANKLGLNNRQGVLAVIRNAFNKVSREPGWGGEPLLGVINRNNNSTDYTGSIP